MDNSRLRTESSRQAPFHTMFLGLIHKWFRIWVLGQMAWIPILTWKQCDSVEINIFYAVLSFSANKEGLASNSNCCCEGIIE